MSLNFVSWKNTALAATLEPNGRHTRQLVYAFLNSANELAILGRDIFFSLRNSMDLCEVAASLEAGGNATK